MLNKRIKSMLVAGIVILGMTGNAFGLDANEYDYADGATHTHDRANNDENVVNKSMNSVNNPSAGEEYSFKGAVKVTISEDKKYAKVEPIKDGNGYDIGRIYNVHVKGTGSGYICYTLEEGETWADQLTAPLDAEITEVVVDHATIRESDRGPAPEEKPIIKETGFESSVTNPFVYSGKEAIFKDGAITVDVSIDDNYESQDVYMYEVLWNPNKYDVTKVTLILDDGHEIYTDLTSEHRSPTEDSTEVEGFKVYKGQGAYEKGRKVKEIKVEYKYASDSDEDGIPDFKDDDPVNPNPGEPDPEPPVEPEDPKEPVIKDDPETGDVGIAGLLLAATGIGAGLVVVNKGKDDEE